ncbi:hypothetical protein CDEST_07113 [Colletotrichum destructivum]|uniref:Uncharacterized protein n=1 Tax=Colletotrichum destructivum TaxID=34406 RepID=A0AAX4IFI5_9PEZI|nr:hypothetical protein CDEST_07113 [Colletotrichum destructivum]
MSARRRAVLVELRYAVDTRLARLVSIGQNFNTGRHLRVGVMEPISVRGACNCETVKVGVSVPHAPDDSTFHRGQPRKSPSRSSKFSGFPRRLV